MTRFVFVAAAVAALGCSYGTRPKDYSPARTPGGAIVAVRVTGDTVDRKGELFAADSAGVTIREVRLLSIPWSRVHAMDIEHLDRDFDILPGVRPDAARIARIAAVSRFPQGLAGPLLREVLSRLRQDSLETPAGAPDGAASAASTGELDALATIAAQASERYRDRRVAMAEGYRRVGADFPGMGEHWVNPATLLRETIDPQRPSFLTYARVRGEPRLLGVGFIATSAGDAPASPLPGWPAHWHEHSGLLAEESGARTGERKATEGTRVWVLHVWTALANPDGRYAADNWSLPYVRDGVTPPSVANPSAARAFGLAGDDAGVGFLLMLLGDSRIRTPANAAQVDSIVQAARAQSLALRQERGVTLDDATLAQLSGIWNDMTAALERMAGPEVVALLAPPHASHAQRRSGSHAH